LSDVLAFVIVLATLVLVVGIVSAPLRRNASGILGRTGRGAGPADPELGVGAPRRAGHDAEAGTAAADAVAELEAARDAKYREIHDTELDHATGKLSDQDFEAIDQALRAEAIVILHELDRAQGR
jgi:hypothetical protein